MDETSETSGEGGGEVGLPGIFKVGGKIIKKQGTGAARDIRPYVKVLLLEYYMKEINSLLDPTVGEIQSNVVYKHFGESYLFLTVSRQQIDSMIEISRHSNRETSLSFLSDPVIEFIENERRRQDSGQIDSENQIRPEPTMYVWILPAETMTVFSILSKEWVDNIHFRSYLFPPLGFIGVSENDFGRISQSELKSLTPLWIWNER